MNAKMKIIFVCIALVAMLYVPVGMAVNEKSFVELWEESYEKDGKIGCINVRLDEISNTTKDIDGNLTTQLSNVGIDINDVDERTNNAENNMVIPTGNIDNTERINALSARLRDTSIDLGRRMGAVNKKMDEMQRKIDVLNSKVDKLTKDIVTLHNNTVIGDNMTDNNTTVDNTTIVVEKAEGGYTIEELYAQRINLAGQEVKVRGKVTKVSGPISIDGVNGTTWIHIQDGTGDATSGNNDLTVVSYNDTMIVGDVILVTGILGADVDLPAGYHFDVLLTGANVIIE